MADREPRRRRKRKEGPRRDEAARDFSPGSLHQTAAPSRESDQELEDDLAPAHPVHEEPSKIAQIVFMLFFMLLVGILCSLFVALKGTPNGDLEEQLHLIEPVTFETEEEVVLFDEPMSAESDDLHMFEMPLDFSDIQDDGIDAEEEEEDLEPDIEFEEIISSPPETTDEEETVVEKYPETVNSPTPKTEPEPERHEDVAEGEVEESSMADDIDDLEESITSVPLKEESTASLNDFVSFTAAPEVVTEPVPHVPVSNTPEEFVEVTREEETRKTMPPVEDEIEGLEDLSFSNYEKADITNEADYIIREELDKIDNILEKNPDIAKEKYNTLLKLYPSSARAVYGKARTLDILARQHRSNTMLEEAITLYQKVMSSKEVPDRLYLMAGERCAERMQFRGYVGKSIKLLLQVAEKFPKNVQLKNKVAVGYLLIGQNAKAKEVLTEILQENPKNGFAQVHLGFILKTVDSNYKDAIRLLSEGIQSREEGVIDGRFYFHLGDALSREGKTTEAMKVYEDGVKEKLFLSVYQRSLYNVNGLSAKPWWDPESTKYSRNFQILERNWKAIRDEALALAGKNMLMPESENLKDKGDWQQFELFVQGRKNAKNCASAPETCSFIEQMSDASTCKRGQVKFSIMQPGTHVWAHTGPTNCRLRAHLGLVIPSGTRIRVANETRTWKDGKILLFDDSFEHEVWHDGTTPRLVLIVDFWHPELTAQQKASLSPI